MTHQYQRPELAQAIPLQPKPVHGYREIWRRIRDNGYDVIPLRGRDGPFKGWPAAPNDDAAIARWQGRATGHRMFESTAFVIDIDVRSLIVRETIMVALSRRWPDFMAGCLRRTSGGTTMALIGQVSTARKRHWTARFKAGEGQQQPHLVEYFTGNDRRYVAVHGFHSPGREYGYEGRRGSILDVRLDSLPWFPEADIPEMIAECERVMLGMGLEQIVLTQPHQPGERVYDLQPDMVMTLSTGARMTLAELDKIAGVRRLKGYATLWDKESKTSDRVLINHSRSTGLALWDTKHGVSHRWASMAPADDTEFAQQLRELYAELQTPWRK